MMVGKADGQFKIGIVKADLKFEPAKVLSMVPALTQVPLTVFRYRDIIQAVWF
ncbi:hypothetical protein GGD38_006423 [Chitinophagaceae bacterium OAS944]|nr:hypothetical protein [Chitinophagaceae bacterium OAS944]